MDIVIASNNKHKISELRSFTDKIASELGIAINVKSLSDIGFSSPIIEDGETFEENSYIKASTVAKLGYTVIADDSGICVDALGGEPGVYSARYAGEESDDVANNEKLLDKMKDVPDGERGAGFVSVVTCVFADGDKLFARGECRGLILRSYRGNGGFGYDPLFYYPPFEKTYAEMTSEEKNMISHRACAIEKLTALLGEELKKRKEKSEC